VDFFYLVLSHCGARTILTYTKEKGNILMKLDIVRAWKDESYRASLSEEQLALLPINPIGEVELSDSDLAGVFGGTAKWGHSHHHHHHRHHHHHHRDDDDWGSGWDDGDDWDDEDFFILGVRG
jgi:mersacidin/lichenicidin family type 2 lantibiotic